MAASLPIATWRTLNTKLRPNLVNKINFKTSLSTSRLHFAQDSGDSSSTLGSASTAPSDHPDPFPVFSHPEVQSLLLRLTGFDLQKLAGPQLKPLEKPSYLLLTDQELSEKESDASDRLRYRLQMPPFMSPRKLFTEPLAVDPELEAHDTAKFVFVDISFGVKDRKRHVVVREPDGSLHNAPWDVKDRVNQIYNPREGRNVIKPAMFEVQNLERMLSEGSYVYILDRACCQFEPDDPDYIRTTHRVYNAVDRDRAYETLRSTRHFGPLAFYLAWSRQMDNLLLDMINRHLDGDAADLVRVFCHIHTESTCAGAVTGLSGEDTIELIQKYVESESQKKEELEAALRALQEVKRSRVKSS